MSLRCSADHCHFNNSGDCYVDKVHIHGQNASTTDHTCCASFQHKNQPDFTNNAKESSSCACTKSIHCHAESCTYNNAKACHADKVHINPHNASCETFRCGK